MSAWMVSVPEFDLSWQSIPPLGAALTGILGHAIAASASEQATAPGHRGPAMVRRRGAPPATNASPYIKPTMWPSGSAKSATVVSGATWVSGMITRPPFASTVASTPAGSSEWT